MSDDYKDNNIWLMKGDCLERMKEIPDKSVDAIITDLPFGITACKWDSVIPFEPMWEQLKRIIKHNGAIVLFGSEPFSSALRISNIKQYKYDWYWNKTKPVGFFNVKKMPLKDIEVISVFYKKQPTYNPQDIIKIDAIKNNSSKVKKHNNISGQNGGAVKTSYYKQDTSNYPRQVLKYSVQNGLHPTQKPVALLEYLTKTYTNEGETVLDFTCGSGSTGVAAVNLGRNFIGIEKDEKYFEIAQNRISEAEKEKQNNLFAGEQ